MSIYKAKEIFSEAARQSGSTQDLQALNEGLYQLALGLQLEIERLHQEVAHVSQQLSRMEK